MKLKGKYTLITGASQGFGRAVAEAFVAEGASVLICARNAKLLEETKRDLVKRTRDTNQKIITQVCDVASSADCDQLIETAFKVFPHMDVLVNNAGISGPKGYVEENDWNQWREAVNINLFSAVYFCRKVLPHFKERNYGKIINLSGGGATTPFPLLTAYAVAKAGLVRFTESLAEEVKNFKITANAISPGVLKTKLLEGILKDVDGAQGPDPYEKAKKIRDEGGVSPEKGAKLCVFLASAEGDGITGKVISAVWDPWETLASHKKELESSDIYTLRRIVPKDRGMGWGEVKK